MNLIALFNSIVSPLSLSFSLSLRFSRLLIIAMQCEKRFIIGNGCFVYVFQPPLAACPKIFDYIGSRFSIAMGEIYAGASHELQVLRFIKATTSIHMTFECHFTWLHYMKLKRFTWCQTNFHLLYSTLFGTHCSITRSKWLMHTTFSHSNYTSIWHWIGVALLFNANYYCFRLCFFFESFSLLFFSSILFHVFARNTLQSTYFVCTEFE